jgi:hypothetical protein
MPEDLDIPSDAELQRQAAFRLWCNGKVFGKAELKLLEVGFNAGWNGTTART